MNSLPPADGNLEEFSENWERSSNLRDVLSKLPGRLVLKSGLSAKRNQLLEQWDQLESPNLDGSLSLEAMDSLSKWIHDAEISIAYIIQIGKEERELGLSHAFAATEDDGVSYEPVDSIEEVDAVSDEWCWPWIEKRLPKKVSKSGMDKKRIIKYGAIGALGVMALVAYMDDEE